MMKRFINDDLTTPPDATETPARRPRLVDVARLAGTSPAVVSTVLNGTRKTTVRVGADTAARVVDAARSLGYVPDPVAQSLASGRNRLLGIFTHEAIFPIERSSFYYPFLVGIEREAEECGYDLLLFTSAAERTGKRAIYHRGVNRLRVAAGAVLLGWPEDRDELRRLSAERFPFTYVGRREIDGCDIAYAAADYAAATSDVVDHLHALGHRSLAYLSAIEPREAGHDRRRGYREAHARLGLGAPRMVHVPGDAATFLAGHLRGWLDHGTTAFVVEDDQLATTFLRVAGDLGVTVPGDGSLAVLGDPLVHTDGVPDWTTFDIPRKEMGCWAARLLVRSLDRPEDRSQSSVVLPCTFRAGSTTAAPPLPRGRGPM